MQRGVGGVHARLVGAAHGTALVVEQAHAALPASPHVACVPGPILTPATAGSNALLLRSDVEIVPELDRWARRLHYVPQRDRRYAIAP